MGSKRTDELVAKLRKSGASVVKRGSRYRVTQPGRELCFLGTSDPKENKGMENKITEPRRRGYAV